MSGRGTLVVDGMTLAITDIRLREGQIQITGTRSGPIPAAPTRNRTFTIFGEDGTGIAQVDLVVGWPQRITRGGDLAIVLPVVMAELAPAPHLPSPSGPAR